MSDTVCIETFPNHIEAGLAQSLLEEYGIKTMLTSDDAGGMRPDLAFTSGGFRLFVLQENAERALSILQEARSHRDDLPLDEDLAADENS